MGRVRMILFFVIFWFNAYSGLVASMILPSADRLIRMTVVGLDGMMVLMALLTVFKSRNFYGVRLGGLFLISVALTMIYTSDRFGILEQLNGLRETIFFFATLIVVHSLYVSEKRDSFVKWMTISLMVFAIAQTPSSFYEFLKYGAGDFVGGTYGTRGGSGHVSQGLFLICFYFIVRYASLEDESHFRIMRMVPFFAMLIPCALNETKVSFLFLGVLLVLLIASRQQVYRAIPLLLMGVLLAFLLNYYYTENVEDTRTIFDEAYLERYLYSGATEAGGDLPRFQRLPLMFKMMGDDVGAILFGMGYGVLGGGNVMGVSRLGRTIYYLVNGSRILLFRVWIQGGLISVLLVASTMFAFVRSYGKLSHVKKQFGRFIAFSLVVMWLYNEAMMDRTFAMITWFCIIWLTYGEEESPAHQSEDGTIAERAEH
jgi:hypothetical protein